jgi:hypothetical protein
MIDNFPKDIMQAAAKLNNDSDFLRIRGWLGDMETEIAIKSVKAKDLDMVKEYQGAYKFIVELRKEFRESRTNVDRARAKTNR